ncbi:MAG: CpaF family protein [Candidatus ainarchaeum sp.]|nr:CpaF family protein [Candidatus ainarchaeum sp.]
MISESVDFRNESSDQQIEELITKIVLDKSKNLYLSVHEKRALIKIIFNDMRRLGVLQPLIDDEEITEIMVNGTKRIFVERAGSISETDIQVESEEKLDDMIQGIVSKVNRTVNETSPLVDARLPDGSRVSVILPPISLSGPIMSIRKFPAHPLELSELVDKNTLSAEAADVLSKMVKARYNIFICGGTGSGKTTFLNALAAEIAQDERVVTIEDSAELNLEKIKNVVSTETRSANSQGKGDINTRDLIKMSLRLRPDRIIVGEVRGAEALDMLQAMNTGHAGSFSTGHANSASDMLRRLETMALIGASLPLTAIRHQISSALDIIVHLARLRDKSRRVIEISELLNLKEGEIELNPLFIFRENDESVEGSLCGELSRTENRVINTLKFKMAGIRVPL